MNAEITGTCPLWRLPALWIILHEGRRSRLWGRSCRHAIFVAQDRERQSRLLKIQYAAITAMKNDIRSATPAMAAIMVA